MVSAIAPRRRAGSGSVRTPGPGTDNTKEDHQPVPKDGFPVQGLSSYNNARLYDDMQEESRRREERLASLSAEIRAQIANNEKMMQKQRDLAGSAKSKNLSSNVALASLRVGLLPTEEAWEEADLRDSTDVRGSYGPALVDEQGNIRKQIIRKDVPGLPTGTLSNYEPLAEAGIYHYDDQGNLHRDGAPALYKHNGSKSWYQHGQLHREDGPAVELADRQEYYQHGELHRTDGPAVIDPDGRHNFRNGPINKYYQHGQLHCDHGPAVIIGPTKYDPYATNEYYQHGERHRKDGPAVIHGPSPEHPEGQVEYWLSGVHYQSQAEWDTAVLASGL